MKKVLSLVLVLVLTFTASVASAGKNEDSSVVMLEVFLSMMGKEDSASLVFDMGRSFAYVDDDGDVIVSLQSKLTYRIFNENKTATMELFSTTWEALNSVHKEFSNAGFYMFVWDGNGNAIYFVGSNTILDIITDKITPRMGERI